MPNRSPVSLVKSPTVSIATTLWAERGIGASIFTVFLRGLVATIQATGTLDRIVDFARERTSTVRGAELWIFGTVTAASSTVPQSR
jgi:Na+/H+ antiporter NhaC